jgi:hypothetical protein
VVCVYRETAFFCGCQPEKEVARMKEGGNKHDGLSFESSVAGGVKLS